MWLKIIKYFPLLWLRKPTISSCAHGKMEKQLLMREQSFCTKHLKTDDFRLRMHVSRPQSLCGLVDSQTHQPDLPRAAPISLISAWYQAHTQHTSHFSWTKWSCMFPTALKGDKKMLLERCLVMAGALWFTYKAHALFHQQNKCHISSHAAAGWVLLSRKMKASFQRPPTDNTTERIRESTPTLFEAMLIYISSTS